MLRDDINNAVKEAMKAKEERKLSTLRMVNSTIKNADIAARGEGKPPLSDADLLGVFQKMIKQRQESVELYDKGGRAELAAQEREEIAIISAYLPQADVGRRSEGRDIGRDRRDRRRRHEGHGQGDRRAARKIRRPDGFRQGERAGEGGADGLSFAGQFEKLVPGAAGMHSPAIARTAGHWTCYLKWGIVRESPPPSFDRQISCQLRPPKILMRHDLCCFSRSGSAT